MATRCSQITGLRGPGIVALLPDEMSGAPTSSAQRGGEVSHLEMGGERPGLRLGTRVEGLGRDDPPIDSRRRDVVDLADGIRTPRGEGHAGVAVGIAAAGRRPNHFVLSAGSRYERGFGGLTVDDAFQVVTEAQNEVARLNQTVELILNKLDQLENTRSSSHGPHEEADNRGTPELRRPQTPSTHVSLTDYGKNGDWRSEKHLPFGESVTDYDAAIRGLDQNHRERLRAARHDTLLGYQNMSAGRPKAEKRTRISTTPMSRDLEEMFHHTGKPKMSPAQQFGAIRANSEEPRNDLFGTFGPKGRGFHAVHNSQVPSVSLNFKREPSQDLSYKRERLEYTHKLLAPTKPENYDGEPDVMKFYKFITQCERFVREARIPPQDQVIKCADYLSGKAYRLYALVTMDTYVWTFQDFTAELFNRCFPPNFRLKQRMKLENFKQEKLTVQDYASELMILFKIVGHYDSERLRVDKLWNGLRLELQSALWKEGLDFESSTWSEVIAVATRHEIAHQMERLSFEDENSTSASSSDDDISEDSESNSDKSEVKPGYNKIPDIEDMNSVDKAHSEESDSNHGELTGFRGKCYACGDIGHFKRDCPRSRTARNALNPSNKQPEETSSPSTNIESYCMEISAAVCGIFELEGASDEPVDMKDVYSEPLDKPEAIYDDQSVSHCLFMEEKPVGEGDKDTLCKTFEFETTEHEGVTAYSYMAQVFQHGIQAGNDLKPQSRCRYELTSGQLNSLVASRIDNFEPTSKGGTIRVFDKE